MLVINPINMNSTDILDKTLAWLYAKEQDASISCRILSYFLQPIGGKTMLHTANSEGNNSISLYAYSQDKENNTFPISRNHFDQQAVTPREVETLTQIILHTLDSDPDRFHDMAEIPGLETNEWMQRMELARYLLKQGLIEANSKETKLFIKLTIKGIMYLRTHDSAA